MATGRIDFFTDSGGDGDIRTAETEEDVFFHMEDCGGLDLKEGEDVEFEIVEAEKGREELGHAYRTRSQRWGGARA